MSESKLSVQELLDVGVIEVVVDNQEDNYQSFQPKKNFKLYHNGDEILNIVINSTGLMYFITIGSIYGEIETKFDSKDEKFSVRIFRELD